MRSLFALVATAALAWSAACGATTIMPSPSPSALSTATPSATPTAQPTATPSVDRDIVYFARDRLPPVGVHVDGAGFGTASEERILSRMRALFAAVAPDGLFNMTLSARTRPSAVTDTGIEQGVVVVDARVRVDRRGSFQSNIGRAR